MLLVSNGPWNLYPSNIGRGPPMVLNASSTESYLSASGHRQWLSTVHSLDRGGKRPVFTVPKSHVLLGCFWPWKMDAMAVHWFQSS